MPSLPKQLIKKNNLKYCPHHGVLLPLDEFKRTTSKSFSQQLWTVWFKLNNIGNAKCPDCLTKMILLNPETKKDLTIDCCPNCYAIWLDKGEGSDLHLAFLAFDAEEKIFKSAVDVIKLQREVGKFIMEHEEKIERYKK